MRDRYSEPMPDAPPTLPIALTIAGSDSGGGAGIQADLKTFHAFGVFGTSALTAVTVQNTLGVAGVHPIPLDVVRAQIAVVAADLRPAAAKTGMLATARLVEEVAAAIHDHDLPNVVVDPVMVATSGDRLLDEDAIGAVIQQLLPLSALVTPNLHEAGILVGGKVRTLDDMRAAARRLTELGAGAALVKGGHLEVAQDGPRSPGREPGGAEDPGRPGGPPGEAVDVLRVGDQERVWRRPKLDTRHTHGTGCTLSSAVAAGLASGRPLPDAVEAAIDFVVRAIRHAPGIGAGNGPVNHFVGTGQLPGLPAYRNGGG